MLLLLSANDKPVLLSCSPFFVRLNSIPWKTLSVVKAGRDMATYQQLLDHLTESSDPPVPDRSTSLAKPVGPVRQKHIMQSVTLAILFGGLGVFLLYERAWFFGVILTGLGALLLFAGFSSKLWVAACPYCSAIFAPTAGLKPEAEGKTFQCQQCFEYSILSGGRVKPHDPKAISEVPTFKSPVFKDGVWPKGCVACGAPPVRLDEVKTRTVNYGMLALGRIWVSSGKATGIPYCEKHKDAVDIKFDSSKRMWLEWCSLQMMRRYLEANRRLKRELLGRKWWA